MKVLTMWRLGIWHVPQRVGGRKSIRYSGSPIAMGFGEAKQQKQVLLVQFSAVANDISSQKSASKNNIVESIIPQLTNTVTPIEKPAKKVASQTTEFMDDLFGFDEQSENNEMTKTAA